MRPNAKSLIRVPVRRPAITGEGQVAEVQEKLPRVTDFDPSIPVQDLVSPVQSLCRHRYASEEEHEQLLTDRPHTRLVQIDLASFKDWIAFTWFERSMKMCPIFSQAAPKTGIFLSSFFITHLKSTPSQP